MVTPHDNTSAPLGYITEESKPSLVTAITSRPVAVGEYLVINNNKRNILGLVEKSMVSSSAFTNIQNFDEAAESIDIAQINKRDKTFTATIRLLGFLDTLHHHGNLITPSIPPLPGTPVLEPNSAELNDIFGMDSAQGWATIGSLLRNKQVPVKINLDKIVSRHLGILAMTGMGKSNLVSLIVKQIGQVHGTTIIFDYHSDYTTLNIPQTNTIAAKINPRLLDTDQLADVLEIRHNASAQQQVLRKAFTKRVRESSNFWNSLHKEIDSIINSDERQLKEIRGSAYRVQDIIKESQKRFDDILDPGMGDPLNFIKEGKTNILNISELSEKQANVALAFYMQQLLLDRKYASLAKHGSVGTSTKPPKTFRFQAPVFVILEEAHVFIPKDHDTAAKYWTAKIAREGRKFGVGLCVVSQRPRSIDLDVLSQMGSFAIMKIIQEDDQRQIAAAAESTSRDLILQLGSLNVGDAILVGQWVNLPSLVHITQVKEKVMGADQSAVDAWMSAKKMGNTGIESTQQLIRHDLLLK